MKLWDRMGDFFRIHNHFPKTALVIAMLAPSATWADEPKTPTTNEVTQELRTGKRPATVTIEMIMEQAVRNIAIRYNLSDDQTEITRKMMKDGVYRFLEEHEQEVWPIIRDLLASQLRPPENIEDVKRIGKAAKPLARAAEKAIYEANDIWREILTPEQKRMHDFDMSEMKRTFNEIDRRLGEWQEGSPKEKTILPTQANLDDGPRRPQKPEGPEVEIFDPKTIFEKLVEQFIKDYELDEGQVTAARSILEEFKVKADDYRNAKKQEFTEIAAKQQQALDNHDLKGVKQAAAEHKKLLQPVYLLCSQMDDRLKGLLTTAQIQQYAEKSKTHGQPPAKTRTASATKAKHTSVKETVAPENPNTEDQPKTTDKTPDTAGKPESQSDR